MMTLAPFALMRSITPWIDDCLKLSELLFIVKKDDMLKDFSYYLEMKKR